MGKERKEHYFLLLFSFNSIDLALLLSLNNISKDFCFCFIQK